MGKVSGPVGETKQSEISMAIEELQQQASITQEIVNRLKHRLSPICRHEPEGDKCPSKPQQYETELANMLDNITDTLKDVANEVESTWHRIEL